MYKSRIKTFLTIITLVMLALVARLGYLQVIKGDEYRRQAEQALQSVELTSAVRGKILDRNNHVMAMDKRCFDFCLDYRFITSDRAWIAQQQRAIARDMAVGPTRAAEIYRERSDRTWQLARQLSVTAASDLEETVQTIVRRVRSIRRIVGMPIREERSDHPVVEGLDEMVSLEGTVGATVVPSLKRSYPYDDLACHILGVTGEVSAEKQKQLNLTADQAPWLDRMLQNYLDGDKIGISGVEKLCEPMLRGQRGFRRLKRTSEGRLVLDDVSAEPGQDVNLTLDVALQHRVTQLLASQPTPCCAVVLSVDRNEVLAMVSVPTYDLNRYRQDYRFLSTNEIDLPLLHRAVQKRYPPGSTAKPLSGVAAVESGALNLESRFNCRGYMYRPGRFRCWLRSGHGSEDLVEAITHSCNIYFYHAGQAAGLPVLTQWLQRFGFADVPGTGLPEEKPGLVPDEGWIRAHIGRAPVPGDARFTAIGQGYFESTPLHIANAMATIARGGIHRSPVLVLRGGPEPVQRDLQISPSTIAAIHEGMYNVCNFAGGAGEQRGTAYRVFHGPGRPLPFDVCGKTGTAQTAPQRTDSNGNGRIDGRDRIVRRGHTALFAGFAPYRNPRVAVAVVVEYVPGGSGSRNAAPLARQILEICSEMGYID